MRWYFACPEDKAADAFIETGTNYGDTLLFAVESNLFKKLISIDCCEEVQNVMRRKFKHFDNVELHTGSSVDVLPKVIDPTLTTTFWLDAHYQGGPKDEMFESHGECPLMAELEIIVSQPWIVRPKILIDDARMFDDDFWTTDESKRFKKEDWCSFQDILDIMNGWKIKVVEQKVVLHPYPDLVIQCT